MKSNTVKLLTALLALALVAGGGIYYARVVVPRQQREAVTEITTVLDADSIQTLDQYPNLQTADLTGSTCYSEILSYASSHQQVTVEYTVPLAGEEYPADTTALTLQQGTFTIGELNKALQALPLVESVSLPKTNLTIADITALREQNPDVTFHYSVMLNGKELQDDTTKLDLSTCTDAEAKKMAKVLPLLEQLKTVDLTGSNDISPLSFATYETLYNSNPAPTYIYSFELYGQQFDLQSDLMDFRKVSIGDDGAQAIEAMLPYLPNLQTLRFDRCDISDDVVIAMHDRHPEREIVWRIYFGPFSCMTDVEKIWANDLSNPLLTDDDVKVLKYCTKVKYLDIGHNKPLTDVSFVSSMPDLEVLIIAMTNVSDLTPLAACHKLEYLELTVLPVTDLSPLSGLTELRHLECGQCYDLTDITPLYPLNLERLNLPCIRYSVPQEQIDEYKRLHPDCDVVTEPYDGNPYQQTRWRKDDGVTVPRYKLLREQIGYDDAHGETKLYDGE